MVLAITLAPTPVQTDKQEDRAAPEAERRQLTVEFIDLVVCLDVAEKKDAMTFSLRLYPSFSDNLITNFQPHFVTDRQFHRVQELLLLHSSNEGYLRSKMGTGEDKFGRYLVFDVTPNRVAREVALSSPHITTTRRSAPHWLG